MFRYDKINIFKGKMIILSVDQIEKRKIIIVFVRSLKLDRAKEEYVLKRQKNVCTEEFHKIILQNFI
jgi:hypothetical protein